MVSLIKVVYLSIWASAFENLIKLVAFENAVLIEMISTTFIYFCEDVVN